MKIDETALRQILQAYGPKGKAVSGAARPADADGAAGGRGDEITISSEGQVLQRMIRAAQQADEVRAARVQELRTKLRTGSYVLDPHVIANRMLGLSGGDGS
jgi:flagellar biosynthesis anti-sigma factor FlgM